MAASMDFSDLGGTQDFSDLGGVPAPAPAPVMQNGAAAPMAIPTPTQAPGFTQRILPDIASGLLNTAQGANRFLTRAIGAPDPAVQAINNVLQQQGKPTANAALSPAPQYNWGQTLGAGTTLPDQLVQGAAGYAPFGVLADAAPIAEGLGAVGMPLATRAAQYLAQSPRLAATLSQVAPSSLYGATQSDNPVSGAATGAALGLAGGIPSGIGAAWSKVSDAISPGKLANSFMSAIGGQQSLTNNAQSLAQDVQNAFTQQKENASALYSPIFDNYGNSNLYNGVKSSTSNSTNTTPVINALDKTNSAYLNLSPKITENFTPDLKDMQNEFANGVKNDDGSYKQMPYSLQGAHNLQSQLGSSIRDYQSMAAKGTLSTADRINMQNYQRAQNAILSDTNGFLDNQQPGLGAQYTAANQNYATNVAPYMSNPAIAKIASGEVNYPKNINTIFAKPTPAIQKIVQDIGPDANNKILYNELGTPQNSATPEKLQNAMSNLDKQGLASYLTPDHLAFQDSLAQKIINKNTALHGLGFLGGALAAHPLGSEIGDVVGGMIGNSVLPPLVKGVQKILPTAKIGATVAPWANSIYPPLLNAGIGAYFQPNQGNQ